MFSITVIGLSCGVISILFILAELFQSLNNWGRLTHGLKWYKFYKVPYYVIKAWMPVITDVGLTLFVVWLFGMSGMIGMMVSLMASALISGGLFVRRMLSK
jgi:hypothetical protein